MEVSLPHGSNLLEAIGIVGGLFFNAYTTWKNEKARKIENLLAINEQYGRIWRGLYDRPALSRVLDKHVDLLKQPVTTEETLFVKELIFHLFTVHRAVKAGMLVRIEGMSEDIRRFLSAPVPKTVWESIKMFQDAEFIAFIDAVCRG